MQHQVAIHGLAHTHGPGGLSVDREQGDTTQALGITARKRPLQLDATGQHQGMLTGKQVVGLRQSGEPAPLLAALDGLGSTAASTLPAARP